MRAIVSSTFGPGNSPPSPGFAPCAILICNSSALVRYDIVTPKRPDATCFIADLLESPLESVLYLLGSSPPSPVLLFPPILFIAMARLSCASLEIEPKLIAPVQNLLTISLADSTCSMGIGSTSFFFSFINPLSVARVFASLFI